MSTWLYLVCYDERHADGPVQADDESGQHLYDLPQIRFDWLRRAHWLGYIDMFPLTLTREYDHLAYFQRNTFAFLLQHRGCIAPPVIESEYGDRFDIEVGSMAELVASS